MRLPFLCLAWVIGIFLGSKVDLTPLIVLTISLPLPLLILWHRKSVFLWASLCLLALIAGIVYFDQATTSSSTTQISDFNDQGTVELKATLQASQSSSIPRFLFSVHHVYSEDKWIPASGKIMVFAKDYSWYQKGDHILLKGKLHTPIWSEDSSNISKSEVCAVLLQPHMELQDRGWLISIRSELSQSLALAMPEPQASLSQAILLGNRSNIPEHVTEHFRVSGTAHLLAISGLHIAILGGMVLGSAAWAFGRQRPTYLLVTLAAIWLYATVAGMNPPVFRAAIMFSLFLLAIQLGRPRSALPTIGFAAAIIVTIRPQSLWDISFQLSFAAIAGLVLLAPTFLRIGRNAILQLADDTSTRFTMLYQITKASAISLAAIVATMPLVAHYFGYISLVSIPATLLTLPALPIIIITSTAVAITGLCAPLLAQIIGWFGWLFLSYTIEVVGSFASLDLAAIQTSNVPASWVLTYYGVLTVAIFAIPARHRLKEMARIASKSFKKSSEKAINITASLANKWVLIIMFPTAALIWIAILTTPEQELEVTFFDVGQGDAILVCTPDGHQLLIDGGPDPQRLSEELGNKLPFWDKSIDMLILTHPQDDHLLGLIEVLKRYHVDYVLEPGIQGTSEQYTNWLDLIEETGVERIISQAGQRIKLGDEITMEVLHPRDSFRDSNEDNPNDNSIVLHLTYKEKSFLFTGDIGRGAEKDLLHQGNLSKTNILKIAHHGSDSSTCEQFLTAVDPQIAVICVGGDNTFGHPAPELSERLNRKIGKNRIFLTSEHGNITIRTNGKKLEIETDPPEI
ncbi:MAG: DNA internalization-related competence protein ComEC/Rec2 [Chloroflexota bacterium]|nr:DNA internalization-related competence protein ComEC/Rec2 [Chloroflexota bacterium]